MKTNTIQRVDEKLTRKEVEAKLDKSRMYLLTLPADILLTITVSYSLVTATSNQFSSKTENAAIERAEFESEREKYSSWIHSAVASFR